MRRNVARILLGVALLLLITSCGSRKKGQHSGTQTSTSTSTSTSTEVTTGEYIPLAYSERSAMRAVWLTTIYGLDWPQTVAATSSRMKDQREELKRILDRLAKDKFNTVFFQVRLRGDVLYRSDIEPMSSVLTGTQQIRPNYDPLAFAIRECRKRGLSIHAWIVTLPLGTDKQVRTLGREGVCLQRQNLCVKHNGEWYLNSANPEARTYLASVAAELVRKYDVDGVHLDYIRYPDHGSKFPDQKEYRLYGKGKSRAQWRTDNISQLVKEIADSVHVNNPYALMSAATLGRYREIPGRKSSGWTCRESVFQDPLIWFKQGSVDFIVPMMYHKDELFSPYLKDWKEVFGNRAVIPGLAAYRVTDKSKWSPSVIDRQISEIEELGMWGVAFYREANIRPNVRGMAPILDSHFVLPVRPLSFHKKNAPVPPQPVLVQPILRHNEIVLRWSVVGDEVLSYNIFFNIYDSKGNPMEDALLYPAVNGKECVIPLYLFPKKSKLHFRVEAMNRLGITGRASTPVVVNLKKHRVE